MVNTKKGRNFYNYSEDMGIFGPIDDKKALEIVRENINIITEETWQSMVNVNSKRGGGVTGQSGDQIMWNIIIKAQYEIPDYIISAGLDIPTNYPYGDPSIFVACAILNKYANAAKEDKKMMSSALTKIKKDGIQGLVDELTKVYCDNIEKSRIKPKLYDHQKEDAIRVLAESFAFYPQIADVIEKNNENQRKRK